VDPSSSSATVQVEYATSASDLGAPAATVVDATPATVSGSGATSVSAAVAGLAPGTTYSARVRATSGSAVTTGATVTFTTDAVVTSSNLTKVYDGDPADVATETTPSGLPVLRVYEGVDGTTYGPSTAAPSDAGTYEVTTTVVDATIGGTEVATLRIDPKPIAVHVTAADKEYDGTAVAAVSASLEGAVPGDDLSVDTSKLAGTFSGPDAGADLVVTIVAEPGYLTGSDASDYDPSIDATTTASIDRAGQTVVFTSTPLDPTVVGTSYSPVAVSGAGLPVTLSVAEGSEGVCSMSEGVVSFAAVGSCTVQAAAAGSQNYRDALAATQVVTVVAADPGPGPDPDPGTPRRPVRLSGGGLLGTGISGSIADGSDATGVAPLLTTGVNGATQDATGSGTGPREVAVEDRKGAASGKAAGNGDDDAKRTALVASTRGGADSSWWIGLPVLAGGGFFLLAARRWRSRAQQS
jgi:hypothetical protein